MQERRCGWGQREFTLPLVDPGCAVFEEEHAMLPSVLLQVWSSPMPHKAHWCMTLEAVCLSCVASSCDWFITMVPLGGVCGSQ